MTGPSRSSLEQRQVKKLRRTLKAILPANRFYQNKFSTLGRSEVDSLEAFKQNVRLTGGDFPAVVELHGDDHAAIDKLGINLIGNKDCTSLGEFMPRRLASRLT